MTTPPILPTRTAKTTAESKAYKLSKGTSTLIFKLATGKFCGFQYVDLNRFDYDPSQGIFLRFTGLYFKLEGRHLEKLFMAIAEQTVSIITVVDESYGDFPEKEPVVTKITVLEGQHDMFSGA